MWPRSVTSRKEGPVSDESRQEGGGGAEAGEYKVGPGRPPKEHQFKPGQSGNPGGRPRGESVTATLRRLLEKQHNGKSIQELVAERIIKEALTGKFQFAKELLDRVEGRPAQKLELDSKEPLLTFVVPAPRVIGQEEAERSPPSGKVYGGIDPDAV
jgi:hypothetical protein